MSLKGALVLLALSLIFPATGVDIGISLTLPMIVGAFVVFSNRHVSRLSASGLWILAFLVWAGISAGVNTFTASNIPSGSLRVTEARLFIHWVRLVFVFAYAWSLEGALRRKENWRAFLGAVTIAAWFVTAVAVYQVVATVMGYPVIAFGNLHTDYGTLPLGRYFGGAVVPRLLGTFGEPKGFGAFINFAWPLVLAARLSGVEQPRRGISARVCGVLPWLMVLELVGTFSRGALLIFVVQLGILTLGGLFRTAIRYAVGAAIGLFLVAAVVGLPVLEIVLEFAGTYVREGDTPSNQMEAIRALTPLVLQRPILGHGPGGILFATSQKVLARLRHLQLTYTEEGYLDATFLPWYVLGSTGFVGTLLFAGYLWAKAREIFRRLAENEAYHRPDKPVMVLMVSSVVGSFLNFTFQANWNDLYPWSSLALLSAAVTRLRADTEKTGFRRGA